MATALEAGFDLSALAACYVALAFLILALFTFRRLAGVFNVSVFGLHPFGSVADAIEDTVIRGLNAAIKSVEKTAARFESGLIDSFGLLIGVPLALALAVWEGLTALKSHYLKPFVHAITDPIFSTANNALARAKTLERDLRTEVARRGADVKALRALIPADIRAAVNTFRRDVVNPIEHRTVALEGELTRVIRPGLSAAETRIAGLAHEIDLAVGAAAAELPRLPEITWDGIRDGLDRLPLGKLAGLLAAIPLLRALVHTLEADVGLGHAECRNKLKQICATDPGAWESLLLGLIAGLALLDFEELIHLAEDAFHSVEGEIEGYVIHQLDMINGR